MDKELYRIQVNQKLSTACENGELNKVRYLLTSEEFADWINIHTSYDFPFRIACRNGHLEVARYLATSPELKEHSIINTDEDYAFKWAEYNKHYHIIKFLIFELNIERSTAIENYLNAEKCEEIKQMFAIRDLNAELQKNLPDNANQSQKLKI